MGLFTEGHAVLRHRPPLPTTHPNPAPPWRRRKSINVLKEMFRDDLSKDDWRLVIKLKKVGGHPRRRRRRGPAPGTPARRLGGCCCALPLPIRCLVHGRAPVLPAPADCAGVTAAGAR